MTATAGPLEARIFAEVKKLMPELVDFLQAMVRIPTVNPPGDNYAACAELIGRRYQLLGYETVQIAANDHPDHSRRYPRVNVIGRLRGSGPGPCLHYNGHLDVVPAGAGWTVDPFAAVVHDDKVWGRGTCDMKGGIAASLYAIEALRRAGATLIGTVEQSATVDEETGGFAGVAYLAERGILAHGKQQHVVITEPLNPDRICLGHRGVWWFDLTVHGRTAHGSMPFLGQSAIANMAQVIAELHGPYAARLLTRRSALPVVPDGARHPTLNINGIAGGQALAPVQSPCVADRCTIVVDRRFLSEENLDDVRAELQAALTSLGLPFEVVDRMIVHPTHTRDDAPIVQALQAGISRVFTRDATLVASPGTYDQKHFSRLAGIHEAVAYGPGQLDLAHQPDEHVSLADLEAATAVMALSAAQLLTVR
ncbi:MAG: acetylornithine deacetylase/succinyl-diaminopimelate desuccinylase family protein [Kofleriaceae bacterium]|nr:acetylornithine deacetylase/succinyl-diaminopimelate desuccinylase family protein [Kofleriaceae bacterium]